MTDACALPGRRPAPRFPFFRLAGPPRALGEQYGRAAGELIRRDAAGAIGDGAWAAGMAVDAVRRLVEQYRHAYARYAPRALAEIEGVAAGAGVAAEEVLYLRCQWDIAPAALAADGCTSFAVGPSRAAGGRLIAGQNKDVPPRQLESVVILALHPAGGAPASLRYAYAGGAEGPGFNSRGLVRLENSLFVSVPGRPTVPSPLLKRLCDESASIDECIDWCRQIRADGLLGLAGCQLLAEASGRIAALEFVPGEFRVVEPRDGLMGHANDPLHPDFAALDLSARHPDWADSRRRTARIDALLRAPGARLSVRYLQRCLADHAGHPAGICRHRRGMRTVASLVAVPAEGTLWVSRGNPCRNRHAAYRLAAP